MADKGQCLQLNARDPSQFIIPTTQEQFEWCFANCTALQSALKKFSDTLGGCPEGQRSPGRLDVL